MYTKYGNLNTNKLFLEILFLNCKMFEYCCRPAERLFHSLIPQTQKVFTVVFALKSFTLFFALDYYPHPKWG